VKPVLKFDGSKISDQKRLARGEHWLLARQILRARDGVHSRAWRVLMLAGGSPHGEVAAIKELMPKANITAIDDNQQCLDAAIDAGVHDVLLCDLANFYIEQRMSAYDASRVGYTRIRPAWQVASLPKFDVVHLDLCGGVTERSQGIFRVYRKHSVSAGGVFIFTFSYGRDVTELFREHRRKNNKHPDVAKMLAAGIPDGLVDRITYLLSRGSVTGLRSVVAYKGSEMPMCSLLVQCNRNEDFDLSFVKLETEDFETAVVYPDAANLYDCPRDRIESFRRRFAALKAVQTRQSRAESSLLEGMSDHG
jgi:hypothetical protein